ncbi:CDP-alcohol phosphatidyltransferase family protein [bacterium]|nr:CDP-alcohol phosphatidyltransferase family protein [bacterium]
MANFITMIRVFFSFIVVALLLCKTSACYVAAFWLTAIVIWFDGLDGYVARKFNEASKFGAMLDILCDRIVECIYWIVFASLGWISLWVPIIVVTRGLITDGLRSLAMEQGYTAFGSSTMMQTKIGKFIVASNFCRFTYAVTKALAFAFLILANTPGGLNGLSDKISLPAYACAYIAVVFCVVRGIPVVIESKRFIAPMMAKKMTVEPKKENDTQN